MPRKTIQDARYRALIGKLRSQRLDLGLSQSDLAIALNRPQQFVSKYESFERRLDIVEFIDIAAAISLDWRDTIAAVTALPEPERR